MRWHACFAGCHRRCLVADCAVLSASNPYRTGRSNRPSIEDVAMKCLQAIACFLLAFASGASFAAAPLLNARESVTIHASPDAVWSRIRDFGGMAAWHAAVASDQVVVGADNTIGTERVLALRDGGTLREKLVAFDDKHRRYSYEILAGSLPVSEYRATVSVKAAGIGRSKVTWSATFKRKHSSGNAAAIADDAAAKATNRFYRSGLDHLKKLAEAK
jgi:mxaD protein